MIQIGVYTTFCQEEGILLQKYRNRNGSVSRDTFQKHRGSGVDSTLLILGASLHTIAGTPPVALHVSRYTFRS